MKVCLINPPVIIQEQEDCEYDESWQTLPHLGLGYIAATVEQAENIKVEIVECVQEKVGIKEIIKKFKNEQYDAVGISTYYYNVFFAYRIISRLKEMQPNCFTFIGGYLPTLSYADSLKEIKNLDCCVIGEGEITTKEIMERIRDGLDWRDVKGIAYMEDGYVKETKRRPLIENLDELPFPRRAFICKRKFVSIITSRGCFGNCIFCATERFFSSCPGHRVRSRSAANSVEEIEYLYNNENISNFTILDDNFSLKSIARKRWIEEFCELIKSKGINIKFRIVTRADEFANGYESLRLLKDAGLEKAFIGIESFIDRQLQFYNKQVDSKTNRKAIEIARELGIKIDMGWVIFDPFTTMEEVRENLRILKKLHVEEFIYDNHVPFSVKFPLMPFVDTNFYDMMKEKDMYNPKKDIPYNFEHNDVEFCYDIIKKWIKIILPIHVKYYLIIKAHDYGMYELEDKLRQEKYKLINIDIDFLLVLCDKIMKNEINDDNVKEFINKWELKLEDINSEFIKAKNVLNEYSL